MRLAHHISGVGNCVPKGDRARHELGRSRVSGEDRVATSTARRQQHPCRSLSAHNGNGRYPPGDSMCEDDATPHGWAYNGTKWPAKADMYLYRSDGQSCSRELVTPSNKLRFAYPSTHQYLLVWNSRPQCVMVIKKLGTELMPQFLELVQWLGEDQGLKVMVEPACYECLSALPGFSYVYTFTPAEEGHLGDLVDFVVCLGGDGVLLHASHLYKHSMPPVVSFHLGSLGFLTNHQFGEYKRELINIIDGRDQLSECAIGDDKRGFMITLRMRLLCQIHRQGHPQAGQRYEVLNEVVLDRGLAPYLTNIECYESGKLVTIVQADGVMLATPTGSTAYSGAAGGAMVHPNVPAILLTPICPHSLSFRPIILPDYADVELRVPDNARCGAWVCFDGKSRQELQRGDSVIVRMSPNPVPTINNIDQTSDWFAGLERCFGWSARSSVQKPLESSPLH